MTKATASWENIIFKDKSLNTEFQEGQWYMTCVCAQHVQYQTWKHCKLVLKVLLYMYTSNYDNVAYL